MPLSSRKPHSNFGYSEKKMNASHPPIIRGKRYDHASFITTYPHLIIHTLTMDYWQC